jgi:hypothetical protein
VIFRSRSLCGFFLPAFFLCVSLQAQNISVSPKLIAFPNQGTGTTSAAYSVTLLNNQTGTLSISSIQAGAPFTQTNNCGASMIANAQCTIKVTFSPTAVQYYSSTLTITDSAGNSPQVVTLTGNGVIPVSYAPKQILFPNQGINSTSSSYSITLTNNESSAISISSISVPAPFSVTNNCGGSLAVGKSCSLAVNFSPPTVKYYSAAVTITDTGGNSPQVIPVTGNGVLPIKFQPAVGGYYFYHQIVNTPSTSQPVVLLNQQGSPIAFTGMSSSAEFPFTTNCGDGHGGGTLAGGASCSVFVTFAPSSQATFNANLTIGNNSSTGAIVIPLTGTGIQGTASPMLVVTPTAPCILPSQSQQFATTFISTPSTAVNWYVDGIHNGNSSVGTISASGLYTAPAVIGTHKVRAVSQTNTTLGGSASISLTATPGLVLDPYVASVPLGGRQTFKAVTCNAPDHNNYTFEVDGILGGNSTVGTITSAGVYTAPTTAGRHQVRLTDTTLNKTTAGQITVFSSITADFGSRAGNSLVVPPGMFGYGRAESIHSTADRTLIAEAGMTEARLAAQITLVFATSTPNWLKVDPIISSIQAAGQHAMLQLNQSPPWLQPTSGSCAGNSYAAPTDNSQWAQMAAQYVAHMDAVFPGVVTDYEIWNEPNSSLFCAADHLNGYLSLYAAAAPAMKAQAARDGKTIRVGGPALTGYDNTWLTSFVTNATTAPYVDFVSYHQYFGGPTNLNVQWDTSTGMPSLYDATQDVSTGAMGNYRRVQPIVAAGAQPGHASTPIYVTEFNTNWAFYQDCCKNNVRYGPLFNALYLVDMLGTVYYGLPQMPAKLFYFAGSAYPYFCLVGVKNQTNDCLYSAGAAPAAYPQYYAFDLLASPTYLGLSGGGHMANTISTPTGGGGLATAAFYTATQDAIVIVNPTSTSYPQITVTFANPGITSTQGTLYAIATTGDVITPSTISFAVQGTSRTTTIDVPPYSVQAVSLK